MRRCAWGWIAGGAFLFQGGFAVAQNSLDALQEELNEAKQQHQEVTTQVLSNFFSQIDPAMGSPEAALNLYAQANTVPSADTPPAPEPGSEAAILDLLQRCGIPPTPVVKENEDETETEKEARLALDQANLARLGVALQLHCGLMHYAALFVVKPDQAGLQDQWVAWLKSAAQIYPQLPEPPIVPKAPPEPKKKKETDDRPPVPQRPPPFYPEDLKGKAVHDSIISKFLGFNAWADKEQGGWSVKDLPKLYRTNVLEPLRASPTAATLAAWDAYIAMANADEPDNDHWNQTVYPPLQFDRACDDYAVAPSTEKLEGLVNLIKANPTNPQADDWISRVGQLMDDYRARHGGSPATVQNPAPTPPAPAGNSNVTVTTVQQGDMTIITTHTNAPSTNAPPAQ